MCVCARVSAYTCIPGGWSHMQSTGTSGNSISGCWRDEMSHLPTAQRVNSRPRALHKLRIKGYKPVFTLEHTTVRMKSIYRFCRLLFSCCLAAQSCLTLCDPMDLQPARLLCPWDSPSKNPGVGCHDLLQQILPTQGSHLPL